MELEFTYRIMGHDGWDELEAAAARAVTLNRNFSFQAVLRPDGGGADIGYGFLTLRTTGHDKSAITRRIVAPIRSIFIRAKVTSDRIQLISSRVMPTMRSATVEEGRAPMGTYTPPELKHILADEGRRLKAEKPATEG